MIIAIALILAGAAFVAFAIVVIGVHTADRHRRLLNPFGIGYADASARRMLGVYVHQAADREVCPDQDNCYDQARR